MDTILYTWNSSKKYSGKKNIIYLWTCIFYFLLFIQFSKCAEYICKNNNDFSKTECFNNIIKIDSKQYRSGHFATTKNGELIIEYSEDGLPGADRLFYRLKPDGRGYYPDDNPIKEIFIEYKKETTIEDETTKQCSGRYEARNIMVNIDGDEKEYLFSTSSWYSLTELYDIESHKSWTWFTSDFFEIPNNKYIFSYQFDVLRQPNTNYYFLVYIQYEKTKTETGDDGKDKYISNSEYYAIKKFNFNSTNSEISKTIHKSINNANNFDNRVISSIIMEKDNKLVVFYINKESDINLYIQAYDYDLNAKANIQVSSITVDAGEGTFFKGVYLSDSYTAVIYYLKKEEAKKLWIKLYKYDNNNNKFLGQYYKEINNYSLNPKMVYNDAFKINENRVIFASKTDENNIYKLYIYLYDFYDTYTKIIVNMYEFSLSDYNIQKEMTLYYFNKYVLFTATISKDSKYYSILLFFGYSTGEDSFIDISPYLSDSNNTDTSINIYNYLKSTLRSST